MYSWRRDHLRASLPPGKRFWTFVAYLKAGKCAVKYTFSPYVVHAKEDYKKAKRQTTVRAPSGASWP